MLGYSSYLELCNINTCTFQLPFDGEEFNYFDTVKQHDLINEWSDSSDSGVSGKSRTC